MHPAIGNEPARARVAERRGQARGEAPGRAARRSRRTPARPNLTDARCRALFASTLQRSDGPGAGVVAQAITATVRQLGAEGCTSRMAQEFGDHPEAATERMRWVRSLLSCP
jgi:hypothetical protein